MNLSRISKKVPHVDHRQTLPALHVMKLKEFADERETLPDKEKLLGQLIFQYNSDYSVFDRHNLYDKVCKLQKEVVRLRNNDAENEYILKAAPFLLEYVIENKKSIKKQEEIALKNKLELEKKVRLCRGAEGVDESKVIINDDENDEEEEYRSDNEEGTLFGIRESGSKGGSDLSRFIKQEKTNKKGQVYEEYQRKCLQSVYCESYKEINNRELEKLSCDCGGKRIIISKEAIAVCEKCGSCVDFADTTGPQEYRSEVEILSPFAYKRVNHFREWLVQMQARESTAPSEDVINKLLMELKKERITDIEDITPKRIKGYLKKLRLNKQYEHVSSIIGHLCGIPPPVINRKLENKLITMFEEIQAPFEKVCPPDRNNFLSYSYTLHKMCELLGEDHLLPCFPYLKSREKLYIQDKIWKDICQIVSYTFYPSL